MSTIFLTEMTHRDRFAAAVNHLPCDRAAFDLCGSPQTLVDYAVTREAIASLLGADSEEGVLRALDIDTRRVGGMVCPPTAHQRVEGGIEYDIWGIGYTDMGGRREICFNPLRGASIDEVCAYEFPDPKRIDPALLSSWAGQAELLHRETDFAVVAEHPVLGVFELGCWMFGFDDYLYRLAAEPELVHAFSARVLEYQKQVIEIYYGALGRFIDCTTSGDDFGTQTGPFMSTDMFDSLVKPYLKERVAHTKLYTDAFYKHHTCGSVHNLIPSLIDCGVDILNPIQPGVYMMEPERLKRDFGGRIAFWGGVDTQHLLPRGSVAEVKAEVRRILGIMAGGGYILSPAHTIQDDVPAENVIAIYRAV